jgi:hypothetical protein
MLHIRLTFIGIKTGWAPKLSTGPLKNIFGSPAGPWRKNVKLCSWTVMDMVVGLWVRIPLRRCVLYTTLCDKVCQWLTTSRWFSSDTPVSSTNNTDRHDIAEILLKVALNTIILTPVSHIFILYVIYYRNIVVYP